MSLSKFCLTPEKLNCRYPVRTAAESTGCQSFQSREPLLSSATRSSLCRRTPDYPLCLPLGSQNFYLNSLLPWGENSLYQSFYSIPGFPAIPTDTKPNENVQKVAYHQQSKIRNDVFDDGDRHALRLRSAKLLTPS